MNGGPNKALLFLAGKSSIGASLVEKAKCGTYKQIS